MNPSISAASPPSPTPSTPDAFAWWRSLLFALLLVASLVVAAILTYAALRVAHARLADLAHPTALNWPFLLAQVIAYVPPVVVLALGLPWPAQRPLRELGLRLLDRRELGWGLGGGVVVLLVTLVVAALQNAVLHLKTEQLPVQLLAGAHDPALILGFAVLACVLAPFVEELIFRAFVFNAIARYVPFWGAALLSGAIFALAHWDKSAFVPLCAVGIALAWIYRRSGSLVSSMIAHGTFNSIQVVLIVFAHQT